MGDHEPVERLRASLFELRVDLPKEHPVKARARDAIRRVADMLLDRGLETSKRAVELDHFHPDRVWYVPSDWTDLRSALSDWRMQPDDVFVDFGSGKGRVVYQAARYPFSRVIGVEISEKLNTIARRNLESKRDKLLCPSVELLTADAAEFEIPDDLTVAYFFHPFGGETFKQVIDNIVESVVRRPRRVRVIYRIPVMEDYLLSAGPFELVRTTKHKPDNLRRIAIYETKI